LEARLAVALASRNGTVAISSREMPIKGEVAEETVVPAASLENGANVWDESTEASFLGEQREQGNPTAPATVSAAPTEEVDRTPLPPLDDLIKRIPAETRAVMDELFRAKFVSVRRIPKTALKES
jgi:hypothetical protein